MRVNARRSVRVECALRVRWLRQPAPVDCIATNMNVHGMFIVTPKHVPVNQVMQLEVQLPRQSIQVFAVVRFAGLQAGVRGLGVELFVVDPVSRRAWLDHYGMLLERSRTGHATRRMTP